MSPNSIKKAVYLVGFSFLGLLCSFLVHAGVEILYIELLVADFERFGVGWSWERWYVIHDVFVIVLAGAGIVGGFWQGRYWWRVIYVEKRYRKWLKV